MAEATKEQVDTEELFKLPQEEKLKIIITELPLRVKIPFFTIGVLGVLTNCLTSAFGGTVVFNAMMSSGYSEFWVRFWSLAMSLFSLHILNACMNYTGHLVIAKILKR